MIFSPKYIAYEVFIPIFPRILVKTADDQSHADPRGTAPAATWRGVWPTYLLQFLLEQDSVQVQYIFKNTLFKKLRLFSRLRRTPMASYMTTMATTKLMANSKLPTPYLSPDAVVSAHAMAEWELGIPPEPNSRSGLNDRFKTTSMMVF